MTASTHDPARIPKHEWMVLQRDRNPIRLVPVRSISPLNQEPRYQILLPNLPQQERKPDIPPRRRLVILTNRSHPVWSATPPPPLSLRLCSRMVSSSTNRRPSGSSATESQRSGGAHHHHCRVHSGKRAKTPFGMGSLEILHTRPS